MIINTFRIVYDVIKAPKSTENVLRPTHFASPVPMKQRGSAFNSGLFPSQVDSSDVTACSPRYRLGTSVFALPGQQDAAHVLADGAVDQRQQVPRDDGN